MIPVFNAFCDDTDPTGNPDCMEVAHAYPCPAEPATGDIDEAGYKTPKFHMIAFNPFYISCVHIHTSDYCPGFELAQEMNPDPDKPRKSLIEDNIPSVEGFFLTNVNLPLDLENHCNVNLGNCSCIFNQIIRNILVNIRRFLLSRKTKVVFIIIVGLILGAIGVFASFSLIQRFQASQAPAIPEEVYRQD